MSEGGAAILPFALKDRWIVTVESDRHFVKVRHRIRWFTVARRKGHEERRHRWASRADALWAAAELRDAFERIEEAEYFAALYYAAAEWKRAEVDAYLETVRGQE